MNPVLRSKQSLVSYSVAILAIAVVYGITFSQGTGADLGTVILDTAVFWITYGIEGIIIWNILNYAIPEERGKTRILLIWATCIIAVTLTVGFETIAIYNFSESAFDGFINTIPGRCFSVMLAYIILSMWYLGEIAAASSGDERKGETYEPTVDKETKKKSADTIERITLRCGQKIKVVEVADIEYIKAEGDYVAIVTQEGRWLKEWTMKHLEENLPHDCFVRIHRSFIVGTKKIIRIERYGKLYQVVLTCGEKIRVSPTGYKTLKDRMQI